MIWGEGTQQVIGICSFNSTRIIRVPSLSWSGPISYPREMVYVLEVGKSAIKMSPHEKSLLTIQPSQHDSKSLCVCARVSTLCIMLFVCRGPYNKKIKPTYRMFVLLSAFSCWLARSGLALNYVREDVDMVLILKNDKWNPHLAHFVSYMSVPHLSDGSSPK